LRKTTRGQAEKKPARERQKARRGTPKTCAYEESGVLVGNRKGDIWLGRLCQRRQGGAASVEFEWSWVLEREERRGDVIGFWHTHPFGMIGPSGRDIRTMHAWVDCLGKPLLCLIEVPGKIAAYLFETGEAAGRSLAEAQRFERGRVVIVERKGS
jgi:proteasome lid subunit RPN8/RPN11